MMASSSKGNPASHRMSNKHRKEARAASWQRGQTRKLKRRQDQEAAHQRNLEAGMTPWEAAKALRRARRVGKQPQKT